jgi:exonuclease III
LKFGTGNVQGCRNKVEEIIREVSTMKMDVVDLTETKRRKQEVKCWEIIYTFLAE